MKSSKSSLFYEYEKGWRRTQEIEGETLLSASRFEFGSQRINGTAVVALLLTVCQLLWKAKNVSPRRRMTS